MPQPPFRADHVGSLLRPASVNAARDYHQAGALDAVGCARSGTRRSST